MWCDKFRSDEKLTSEFQAMCYLAKEFPKKYSLYLLKNKLSDDNYNLMYMLYYKKYSIKEKIIYSPNYNNPCDEYSYIILRRLEKL